MNQMPPLEYLRTFEAAARHMSFTEAALELNRTQASVSQHIRALEAFLGRPLFHRLHRSVHLTELGQAYLPSVRTALEALGVATSTIFGPRGNRKLVISAPVAFIACWLIPRVHGFIDRYPSVEFEFQSTIWPELSFDSSVLYFRFGSGKWDGMHARRVASARLVTACAPDYTVEGEHLTAYSQMRRASLINIVGWSDGWSRWLTAAGLQDVEPVRQVRTDNSYVALEMARKHYGVALTLDCYVHTYVAQGLLRQPFHERVEIGKGHYLLMPEGKPLGEVAEAFADWVTTTGDTEVTA